MEEGFEIMYKEIPFYNRRDTIKSIKEIGNHYYEVEIYDIDGSFKTSKIIISKEQMLNSFINEIDAYLYHMKDNYEEAKRIIGGDVVKKNLIKMLVLSVIVGVSLPTLGYVMNSVFAYYLGFAITAVLCVPTFYYSIHELIVKSSEKEMRRSIKQYEDLKEEKVKVKKEIEELIIKNDKSNHKRIEPMKHEVKEEIKSLVRKKE